MTKSSLSQRGKAFFAPVVFSALISVLIFTGCTSKTSPNGRSAAFADGRRQLKATLKDPSSLEVIEEKVFVINGRYQYGAEFRARNSFGAYDVDTFSTDCGVATE